MEVRPTFEIPLSSSADETMRRLRAVIVASPYKGRVDSLGRVADFRIPAVERRFWSPHLTVQAEVVPEGGCKLYARFSPRPEIWTGIMLFYLSVLFLMLSGFAYGYAQWIMSQTPWALLCLPLGVIFIGFIHLAAVIGQRLSSDQMLELRSLLERALAQAETISNDADRL